MIITQDMMFTHQMTLAIKELLKDFDKSPLKMTPESLMDFVEDHKDELGHIVATMVFEWSDSDDWYNKVTKG